MKRFASYFIVAVPVLVGALSLLVLVRATFDVTLAPLVNAMMNAFEDLAEGTVTLSGLEPLIRWSQSRIGEWLGIDFVLSPSWKYVTVLM